MAEGKVIKPTADEITETLGDAIFQVVTKAFETQDEFIFQAIKPFCETQTHMVITKDKLIRALTLLAEKEPVEPKNIFTNPVCGVCDQPLDVTDDYCRHCGRGIKWYADGD